jgi:predicted transporter
MARIRFFLLTALATCLSGLGFVCLLLPHLVSSGAMLAATPSGLLDIADLVSVAFTGAVDRRPIDLALPGSITRALGVFFIVCAVVVQVMQSLDDRNP